MATPNATALIESEDILEPFHPDIFSERKKNRKTKTWETIQKNHEATGSREKNKKDKKIMLEMLDRERKF
ncbi:MAG: hypothetical protein PVJ87_11425 [Desulfobacterales bacterium]|jgi:hypothetical protein